MNDPRPSHLPKLLIGGSLLLILLPFGVQAVRTHTAQTQLAERWETHQALIEARVHADTELVDRGVFPGRTPDGAGDAGPRYEALLSTASVASEHAAAEAWLTAWNDLPDNPWEAYRDADTPPSDRAAAEAAQGSAFLRALIPLTRLPACSWTWNYALPEGDRGLGAGLARFLTQAHLLHVARTEGPGALVRAAVDVLAVARDLLSHPDSMAGGLMADVAFDAAALGLAAPDPDPAALQDLIDGLPLLPDVGLRNAERLRLQLGCLYALMGGLPEPFDDAAEVAAFEERCGRTLEPFHVTLFRIWSAFDTSQQTLLDAEDLPLHELLALADARVDAVVAAHGSDCALFTSPTDAEVDFHGRTLARARALRLLARLRLAELEGSARPPSVDAIDPAWIERDPYTHTPLCVQVEGQAITAYARGRDGADSGGPDAEGSDDHGLTLR